MASKFELNNSTPAAPAGRINIVWQSDAAGNVSGNIPEPAAGGAVASVFGRTGAVVAVNGDYTAAQVSNAVSVIGSYADPAWITSIDWTKIVNEPATFQTPWTQHIDGSGFSLSNTGDIGVGPTARMALLSAPTDGASDSGALTFSTRYLGALGERVRIAADGRFGIGTSLPQSKLAVTGASGQYTGSGGEGLFQITTGSGAQTDEKLQMGVFDGQYAWIQAIKPGTGHRPLEINAWGGGIVQSGRQVSLSLIPNSGLNIWYEEAATRIWFVVRGDSGVIKQGWIAVA